MHSGGNVTFCRKANFFARWKPLAPHKHFFTPPSEHFLAEDCFGFRLPICGQVQNIFRKRNVVEATDKQAKLMVAAARRKFGGKEI